MAKREEKAALFYKGSKYEDKLAEAKKKAKTAKTAKEAAGEVVKVPHEQLLDKAIELQMNLLNK